MFRTNNFFLCCLLFVFTYSSTEVVKVSLFYEVSNPECRQFITTQVYPTYQQMPDNLLLEFVPFGRGNVTYDNGIDFICHHGDENCFGSRMQACVLRYVLNTAQQVNFVGCIMNSTDPTSERMAQNCTQRMNIEWQPVHGCINGTRGDKALQYFANRTLDIELKTLPRIEFAYSYDEVAEKAARGNFRKYVCSQFKYPPDCCDDTFDE